MAAIDFKNSQEFKDFTSKVCSHLEKTKLNQLRHAIAKTLDFQYVQQFYDHLDSADNHAQSQLTPETAYNGMRILALPSFKGGTGKTTWTEIVSVYASKGYFSSINKKVLVIDFCGQANASRTLMENDVNRDGSEHSSSTSIYYDSEMTPHPSTLFDTVDVLHADSMGLLNFEQDVGRSPFPADMELLIKEYSDFFRSEEVQAQYDLIVIDCESGMAVTTQIALKLCTDVLLTTIMGDRFAAAGLNEMISNMEAIDGGRPYPMNVAGVVPLLTRPLDKRSSFGWNLMYDQLRSHPKIGRAMPKRPVRFRQENIHFFSKDGDQISVKEPKDLMVMLNEISINMYNMPLVLNGNDNRGLTSSDVLGILDY